MAVKPSAQMLIFTSYAAANAAELKRLKIYLQPFLQKNGARFWDFREDTALGASREQEIAEHLQAAQIILLLLSPDYLYDSECWQQMQQALGRSGSKTEKVYVIPILLRPCNLEMLDLRGLLVLPRNGSPIKKWPDPEEAMLHVADEICKVVRQLRVIQPASKPSLLPPPLPLELINPYVGLQPFNFRNANYFFGRKRLVRKILEELQSAFKDRDIHNEGSRLLAIIGPSGAGKSSLVHAGVLPALTRGALLGSNSWLILNTVYPGRNPLIQLANVLLPHLPPLPVEWLETSEYGLVVLARSILQTHRQQAVEQIVLVIDQFENLFTLATDEVRRKFIQLLTTAAKEENGSLIILLLLRADFYGQLMESPAYSDLFHLIDKHHVNVLPMSEEELHEAIVEPTKLPDVQATFEPELIDLLLKDMAGQRNALPWLQHILQRLFEESKDRYISRAAYERIGKLEGTLALYADKVYMEKLPTDAHREAARNLFFALSAINDTDHTVIVRHRVPRADVGLLMGEDGQRVMQETIDILLNERLLSTDLGSRSLLDNQFAINKQILDISHEALLREWPRFQEWVKLHQEQLLICQRIDMDITRWEQKGRPASWLYRDHNLQELDELNKIGLLNERRRFFMQASKQANRRRKTQQLLRNSLLVTLILILIGTVVASIFIHPFASPPPDTVWNSHDSGPGSLRQVIHDAHDQDTIYIADSLAGQTITLHSDLDINKSVTLRGANSSQYTSIQGTPAHQLYGYKIRIAGKTNVTFEHLAFTGGSVTQDGMIYNQGVLAVTNCWIHHNRSDYNGGALVNAGGSMILSNTTVEDNRSNGNGGSIYNWNGSTVITNNSIIQNNTSLHNGGGIYSLRGSVHIINSLIKNNGATSIDNNGYFGGGIDLQNAEFSLINSTVVLNHVNGNGGGLAVQGGNALIDNSTIVRNYVDNGRGGGLFAAADSENGRTAQIIVTHTEINDDPKADSFIGSNTYNKTDSTADVGDTNIAGVITSDSNRFIITSKNTIIITGNPRPKKLSAEQNPTIYLGPVDIDAFCQSHHYSFGNPSEENSSQIRCLLSYYNDTNFKIYPAVAACQWRYPPSPEDVIVRKDGTKDRTDGAIIDRLADYYDPSSLQCYHNVQKINYNITDPKELNTFCLNSGYQGGLNNNEHKTAYDWKCKDTQRKDTSNPPQFVSVGISITDACRDLTGEMNAFDRLSNFNDPNGWECWTQK